MIYVIIRLDKIQGTYVEYSIELNGIDDEFVKLMSRANVPLQMELSYHAKVDERFKPRISGAGSLEIATVNDRRTLYV